MKKVLFCSGSMCWEGRLSKSLREPERNADGSATTVPYDLEVKRVWFIRSGMPLNEGYAEKDVVELMETHGVDSMWVDSESDARAMAMEG